MYKVWMFFLGMCLIAKPVWAEVNVAYFHNSVRCKTCLKMEKWSAEAVKNLNVSFDSINTDEPQNKHYLQDYRLYTKSVIVRDTQSGKWRNLDKIWELAADEERFKRYIRQEVEKFAQE